MLIDWLLDLFQVVLNGLGDLLPSTDADPFSNLQTIGDNLGALNYFLPISETFAIVIGVMVIFPAFMGISLLLWILALIRGGSARG